MRFRLRKTLRLGPVRVRASWRGPRFAGLGWGWWSWSARTGRHRINTPGPGSVELGRTPWPRERR